MLTVFDKKRACFSVVNGDAISSDVNEAAVRVLLNHAASGADVATAVVFMPLGRGKTVKVDVIVLQHAFQDRSRTNFFGRHRTELGHDLCGSFGQARRARLQLQTERDACPFYGVEQVRRHPVAFGIVSNLIEEQRRPAPLDHQLGDAADVLLPTGAVDSF